jgi:cell shape-determining protein MreC
MQFLSVANAASSETRPDILFACEHCATQLLVVADAAGATVQCQQCHQMIVVPNVELEAAATNAIRISEVQHQLKENESQRTEIAAYINQHTIQLQRWQLRLQTLNERNKKLRAELAALRR